MLSNYISCPMHGRVAHFVRAAFVFFTFVVCFLFARQSVAQVSPGNDIEIILRVANSGTFESSRAQYFLYEHYFKLGNCAEALQYLQKSVQAGYTPAWIAYAKMLTHGYCGVEINAQEALRYYKMASERGDPEGLYQVGLDFKAKGNILNAKKCFMDAISVEAISMDHSNPAYAYTKYEYAKLLIEEEKVCDRWFRWFNPSCLWEKGFDVIGTLAEIAKDYWTLQRVWAPPALNPAMPAVPVVAHGFNPRALAFPVWICLGAYRLQKLFSGYLACLSEKEKMVIRLLVESKASGCDESWCVLGRLFYDGRCGLEKNEMAGRFQQDEVFNRKGYRCTDYRIPEPNEAQQEHYNHQDDL